MGVNRKFDFWRVWKFCWDLINVISGGNWLFRWDCVFQVGLCNSLRTMLWIKPLNQLRLIIWTVYVIYLELVVFLSFDVNSCWLIDWSVKSNFSTVSVRSSAIYCYSKEWFRIPKSYAFPWRYLWEMSHWINFSGKFLGY